MNNTRKYPYDGRSIRKRQADAIITILSVIGFFACAGFLYVIAGLPKP